MAGKKLLNCFVKFTNIYGFEYYFRVIRQENNLCTLSPLYNNKKYPKKIIKKVDELEKVEVVNLCLKSEEIEKINSDLNKHSRCFVRHKYTKMFEKAWRKYNTGCILHIENHKYPHLFYNFGFCTKHLDEDKKLYYTMIIYELLYKCNKHKHE